MAIIPHMFYQRNNVRWLIGVEIEPNLHYMPFESYEQFVYAYAHVHVYKYAQEQENKAGITVTVTGEGKV